MNKLTVMIALLVVVTVNSTVISFDPPGRRTAPVVEN